MLLRYGAHSDRLHDSTAALVRWPCNTVIPWRMVALDKCPGVRQIGVGETLRRIIGKTVRSVTRCNLEDVCGNSQLCGGVRSGY